MSFHIHELDLSKNTLKKRVKVSRRTVNVDLYIPKGRIKIIKTYKDAFNYPQFDYKPDLHDIVIGDKLFERVWIFTDKQAGEEDAQSLIDDYNKVTLKDVKSELISFLETVIQYLKNE